MILLKEIIPQDSIEIYYKISLFYYLQRQQQRQNHDKYITKEFETAIFNVVKLNAISFV